MDPDRLPLLRWQFGSLLVKQLRIATARVFQDPSSSFKLASCDSTCPLPSFLYLFITKAFRVSASSPPTFSSGALDKAF